MYAEKVTNLILSKRMEHKKATTTHLLHELLLHQLYVERYCIVQTMRVYRHKCLLKYPHHQPIVMIKRIARS